MKVFCLRATTRVSSIHVDASETRPAGRTGVVEEDRSRWSGTLTRDSHILDTCHER